MYAHIDHQLYVQKYSKNKQKQINLKNRRDLVTLVASHPILRALFDLKNQYNKTSNRK